MSEKAVVAGISVEMEPLRILRYATLPLPVCGIQGIQKALAEQPEAIAILAGTIPPAGRSLPLSRCRALRGSVHSAEGRLQSVPKGHRMLRFSNSLLLIAAFLIPRAAIGQQMTVREWTFQEAPRETAHGAVSITADGLQTPRYPEFAESNRSLNLDGTSYLTIPDRAGPGRSFFDFDNGDSVTFETWVRLNKLGENACIISKGRTGRSGEKAFNQNWAFRLRKTSSGAGVNFLFRSRGSEDAPAEWHRWTSKGRIGTGARWHHVALSYTFGKPETLTAVIDGKKVSGSWDMGGPTDRAPIVDNDDVIIGSTMTGLPNNTLNGSIDNLRVHRRIVPLSELLSRYRYSPRPTTPPQIPPGKVVVELYDGFGSPNELPEETDAPRLTWHQNHLAFARMPQNYDSWGIRSGWNGTILVRAWADLELPAGRHSLLVRSRGLSRVWIDGKEVLATSAQRKYGGAHQEVPEIPEVPLPGMRPAAMSDGEALCEFDSDGKVHRVRWDMLVGGPAFRREFGENCIAVSHDGNMFHLAGSGPSFPLTDQGWQAFRVDADNTVRASDTQRRRRAATSQNEVWNQRHRWARSNLMKRAQTATIDELIAGSQPRQAEHNVHPAEKVEFYNRKIAPILNEHCGRCHIDRQRGGLLLSRHARLLAGGESGTPAVIPGKPEESLLIQLIKASKDEGRMPPRGDGVSPEEVRLLEKWIMEGAAMPIPSEAPRMAASRADDLRFLRRVSLLTIGVPPTLEEVREYLNTQEDKRRQTAIDRLVDDPRWADNRVGYWQDTLAENPNLLKPTLNNTGPFRWWIHEALVDNKAADRFATELIMMRGSEWYGGSAGFGIASQNDVPMAAKAHVIGTAFLGVNLKCARCHDAPYHRWKQSDLFEMAAMLDRKQITLPASSTVPVAFFEKRERDSLIEVSLKPPAKLSPRFPFEDLLHGADSKPPEPEDSRERLAFQITTSRRFAEVIANREWKWFMGEGIVEPVDDWADNPASNPILLGGLADLLIQNNYDLRAFATAILKSNAFQSRLVARRMTAEQVVDSAFHVSGRSMQTEQLTLDVEGAQAASRFLNFGYPRRAWEFTTLANERDRPSIALPAVQTVVDVLKAFGWRDSRPEPLTDRRQDPDLVQPGSLANGTLGLWLTTLTDESELTQFLVNAEDVDQVVDSLFLKFLTRFPTPSERERFRDLLSSDFDERAVAESDWGTPHQKRRFRSVSWSNHLSPDANVIRIQQQQELRDGPPPTRYLEPEWRERAEDAIWSLLNSPEMIMIP